MASLSGKPPAVMTIVAGVAGGVAVLLVLVSLGLTYFILKMKGRVEKEAKARAIPHAYASPYANDYYGRPLVRKSTPSTIPELATRLPVHELDGDGSRLSWDISIMGSSMPVVADGSDGRWSQGSSPEPEVTEPGRRVRRDRDRDRDRAIGRYNRLGMSG
ncbi:MAG: hypothetical protein M1840_005178 [Geoglossum simile]|nr:MAG: hypothetical protein M1840_005178 [Geoglossum simile]